MEIIGKILLNIAILISIWLGSIVLVGCFGAFDSRNNMEGFFTGAVLGNFLGIILGIIGFVISLFYWAFYFL